MTYSFDVLGGEHLLIIFVSTLIGFMFLLFKPKDEKRRKYINYGLILTLIVVRGLRYWMDIYLGTFLIGDLISLHVCNIDLYVLIFCLLFPNRKAFMFTYLIGIPTALSVVLFPGSEHLAPGFFRVVLFVMSHMLLVMSSIYLLVTYKFKITIKDLIVFDILAIFGMVVIYIYNYFLGFNYLYLMEAPPSTILENLYNMFGKYGYIGIIYLLLVILSFVFFGIYKIIFKRRKA